MENLNRNLMNLREKELKIVIQSPSKVEVPDGWLVEQKPRPSNPNHIDRVGNPSFLFQLI